MNPTPGMIAASDDLRSAISRDEHAARGDFIELVLTANVGPEIESRDKRIAELEYRHRELLDAFAKHLECGPLDGMDLHEAEETVANNYFLRMTQACELRDSLSKRAEQAEADAAVMRGYIEGEAEKSMKSLEFPRAAPGHHLEDELLRRIAEKLALFASLLDGTAGRDLLDELKRLREQNRKLMDGIANIVADSDSAELTTYGTVLLKVQEALKQLASEESK